MSKKKSAEEQRSVTQWKRLLEYVVLYEFKLRKVVARFSDKDFRGFDSNRSKWAHSSVNQVG
jgi:hypothetical protein